MNSANRQILTLLDLATATGALPAELRHRAKLLGMHGTEQLSLYSIVPPEIAEHLYPSAGEPASGGFEEKEMADPMPSPPPTAESTVGDEIPLGDPHRKVTENERDWSYRRLFAAHLRGASHITLEDPFISQQHQFRNLTEFLELIYGLTPGQGQTQVNLRTKRTREEFAEKQATVIEQIKEQFAGTRVAFSWQFDDDLHDRCILTDTGWKLTLGRGLDIFQSPPKGLGYAPAIQERRLTKRFTITYVRPGDA